MRVLRTLPIALLALSVWAQPRKGPPRGGGHGPPPGLGTAAIERFIQMEPGQREKVLGKLPPDRRRTVEERMERYNRLSPEEKGQLQEQYQRFQKLPPEQQDEARRAFRRFNNLPEDRQKALREEMDALRKMSPEERRVRINSPDFVEKFPVHERRLIRDMERAFDARPTPEPEEL